MSLPAAGGEFLDPFTMARYCTTGRDSLTAQSDSSSTSSSFFQTCFGSGKWGTYFHRRSAETKWSKK